VEPSSAAAASGKETLARARKIYTEVGPRDALPEFERALELFRKEGDRNGEAVTLGNIGNCHKRLGDYPKSLDFHHRALALKREIGDRLEEGKTLNHLGLVHWDKSEFEKAIDYFTKAGAIARDLSDQSLEATALNNLSLVYDEIGDFQRSLEGYEAALKKFRALEATDDESFVLGNLGGRLFLLGRFREALRYYQQSLAISERLKLKQGASMDLGNLGLCYTGLGQIPEALSHFDRALAMAEEAGLNKESADWRKGKASALVRIGRYTPALGEYGQALQTYERAGLKREWTEALNDRGSLHLLLGDVASAERDFRQAIEISRAIGHPRGVTLNLAALAGIELRRSRLEQAAELYREAITRAREADDRATTASGLIQLALTQRRQNLLEESRKSAEEAIAIARSTEAAPLEAAGRYALGELLRSQGNQAGAMDELARAQAAARSLADPDLDWRAAYARAQALESLGKNEEALSAYQEAIKTIESVRGQLAEERFRAGYIEDKSEVYVALVQLLLKLGRLGDAFQVAEKLRARAYLDLLHRGQSPLHNAQGQRETELRERIRRLQKAFSEEQGKPPAEQKRKILEAYSAELADAERQFQNLLDDLAASDPAYAALAMLRVPTSAEVQARLPAGTALVDYLAGEDRLTIFVITQSALHAKTIPIRLRNLRAKVELLRDLIARPQGDDWYLPAKSLRQSLLEPVEHEGWLAGITQLILVPNGLLHYVPFAALPREANGKRRFLVDEYRLAFLPAAAALTSPVRATAAGLSLMALAPSRARLRFTGDEARAVAGNFPGNPLVLVGSSATEAAFKKRGGEFAVLHFATHGYFNKFNPLFSGVELEPGEGEDGRLEVHEILGLRLNAGLVALSACETALGSGYFTEMPSGDDLVGLTRAFLYAGSPAVLATLWEVNDRSTLELMRSFYARFAKGGKAAALADAQRKMRNGSGRFQHPYYWAPFILVGAPQ
jgi:CHAT domain-containing protein/Tfp pilus assembly protein PilF